MTVSRTSPRLPTGAEILHDPRFNKGTAFTEAERDRLGIRGLLPPRVFTQAEQQARVLENYRAKTSDLEKYIFLIALQDRNECLFYSTVIDNIDEMMPIIYTPEVGEACRRYAHIFRRPRGLFISLKHLGRVEQVLRNWPEPEVGVIVVTDGERILGLGDLGANGMGIPIGKLTLYTVCSGVHPALCLPVTLDVGTNNSEFLSDPLYIGLRERRVAGEIYEEFVDEFVRAVQTVFPRAVLQFEDFGRSHAFSLLERYHDQVCCFNDDIQGTGGVALAGLLSALRITGGALEDQRVLFFGAGEGGVGMANIIVAAMEHVGLKREQARNHCWLFDSRGLVTKDRTDLEAHKHVYAHDAMPARDLLTAVKQLKPTVLIGASAQPQTFDQPVLQTMAQLNDRPIIFALSNPTSKAECTAEQAYVHTRGRAIFASGSPFKPLTVNGHHYVPGQGNNAYIFPGIGLGAIAAGATRITDEMFFVAATTLASLVSDASLESGCIYPPLTQIREVSAVIAEHVARLVHRRGLATRSEPEDVGAHVRSLIYDPTYPTYA